MLPDDAKADISSPTTPALDKKRAQKHVDTPIGGSPDRGGLPAATQPSSQISAALEFQISALIRSEPEAWFRSYAKVKLKDGRIVTGCDPSPTQKKMFEIERRCRLGNSPCKILVLKPRRDGATTGAQAIIYHRLQSHTGLSANLMANTDETSKKTFQIFERLAKGDAFDWDGGNKPPEVKADLITLSSGGSIGLLSSRGCEPGRGDGSQMGEMTEAAFFTETGDPTGAFIASVRAADESPVGLLIADSTANGPRGWFYEQVMAAKEKQDRGKQKIDDWHLVFVPWWEGMDVTRAFKSEEERVEFLATLRGDEEREINLYGTDPVSGKTRITLEHLNWRRRIIDNECGGDVDKFRRENPSDIREAFLLRSRTRFDQTNLDKLERAAIAPTLGDIAMVEGVASFVPDLSGQWQVWEHPKFDVPYVIAVDTMTGEDQVSGKDPDWHSVGVLSGEYTDQAGRTYLPRLVARHSSRLELGVLAVEVEAAARWYGCPGGNPCMVIPEMNSSGLVMVKHLHDVGVPLFKRRQTNKTTSETTEHLGWRTDETTRKTILDSLAMRILKNQWDCPSAEVVAQMRTFIVTKNGRAEGMAGRHDDDVLMMAIGLYNIGMASKRTMPKRKRQLNMTDGYRLVSELR